jgi:3-deoxy-D-manno-octulosonic-acid transferase
MILVYKLITIVFYPLIVIIIYLRKLYGKEDAIRYKEKIFLFSIKSNRNFDKKLIWFHAASVGEIQSIENLIKEYNKRNFDILITTVTKTAADLVENKYANDSSIHHRYFPVDTPFIVKKFIDQWSPSLVVFVDSEIWPNLMFQIKIKNITSVIVNARITRKSFKRWMLVHNSAKKIFEIFDLCLTANKETTKFLNELNAKNVKYLGNLKLSNEIHFSEFSNGNDKTLKNKNFWCAVSTHNGEDIFFLKSHLILKKKINDVLTIIIPRHVNRSLEIKKLCKKFYLTCQILNQNEIIDKNKDIVIINHFGGLNNYLKYSKSVFIGKSLLKKFRENGGQNPIEAAKLGCKIYHGPHTYNFLDIYKQLKSLEIAYEISNFNELANKLIVDFKANKSIENESIVLINNLGKKVLRDNLREIDSFLRK